MIVSNNEKQFKEGVFPSVIQKAQDQTNIHFRKSSPRQRIDGGHKQRNSQRMEKRLVRAHKGWVDELLQVLWTHRTSLKRSIGETSFSLTYGTKVVLRVEISIPTKRTRKVAPTQNEKDLRMNLELLEERRDIVAIREVAYKKKLEKTTAKK
ncbi:reverse transcriptase domain-containing protein [Tanacetum coccineum]